MTNPTEQFSDAVESALESLSVSSEPTTKPPYTMSNRPAGIFTVKGKAEALASIQASTILLLEGLKEKVRQGGIIRQSPYEVIDELIKELEK